MKTQMQLQMALPHIGSQAAIPTMEAFEQPDMGEARQFWDDVEGLALFRSRLYRDLLGAKNLKDEDREREIVSELRQIASRIAELKH